MKIKSYAIIGLLILGFQFLKVDIFAQTEDVLRLKIINPGIAFEKSLGKTITLETGIGFGYNFSYPNLQESSEGGVLYMFAPFVDIQGRKFYNLAKRERKDKSIEGNSGNFIAVRMLYTGVAATSNFVNFSDHSFAIGPTWGLQRNYGKINFQTSVGPIIYFDPLGNSGWFPLNIELNLGINLNKKL